MNKQYKWTTVSVCLLLLSNLSYAQRKIKTDFLYRRAIQEATAQNRELTRGQVSQKLAKGMTFGSVSAFSLELFGIAGGPAAGTLLAGGAVALAINSAHEAFVFSGKNRADLYPAIAQAIAKSPSFSNYKIVLVDAPHVTTSTKQALIHFLLHPNQELPMEKLGRGAGYRFYIEPYNQQVFADVDPSRKIIFIRNSSINPAGKKVTNHFIESTQKEK